MSSVAALQDHRATREIVLRLSPLKRQFTVGGESLSGQTGRPGICAVDFSCRKVAGAAGFRLGLLETL